jgi:hypothetical protein
MPRHQLVTTSPDVSESCSVCDARNGCLTTDCPGTKIDDARQQEVLETDLDYTDDRGWHLSLPTPAVASSTDPRALVAPHIDWRTIDRNADLQHELSRRAIAWVIADRSCDDQSALCTRLEDEVDETHLTEKLRTGGAPTLVERELLVKLESAKIAFQVSCHRVEKCEEEFKQAARRLVASLESAAPSRGFL